MDYDRHYSPRHHRHRNRYHRQHRHYHSKPKSKLRAVHNVAGGPNVDIFVDGRLAVTNVPYKAISDYLLVDSGKHIVSTVPSSGGEPLTVVEIDLKPKTRYTAVVHGALSDGKIDTLALQDNISCPDRGNAHLRFVHAAATVPAVDIYANGDKIFENVSYGQTGKPMYLPVPKNVYTVEVTPAGDDTVVLSADLPLQDQQVYTVIASGLLDDRDYPIDALVSEDNHGMCVVLH